jgi:hypothetical protein
MNESKGDDVPTHDTFWLSCHMHLSSICVYKTSNIAKAMTLKTIEAKKKGGKYQAEKPMKKKTKKKSMEGIFIHCDVKCNNIIL